VIVEDFQVTRPQSSLRLVEVDFYGVASYWDHPEDVIPVNVHIVIVDLLSYRQGVRSNWNGIEIESDKTEGTVMLVPVCADESALTEAHVRPECQGHASASHGVCSRSTALYVCQSDEAVEVSDLRRIADVGERSCGIEWIVVDKDPVGAQRCETPWNRI
jgi:hypothetical protein